METELGRKEGSHEPSINMVRIRKTWFDPGKSSSGAGPGEAKPLRPGAGVGRYFAAPHPNLRWPPLGALP